nr:alpha/beta fold hydrolase [Panacagrimonas sp.]
MASEPGVELHEGGAGEPLVLLHGVGGNWQIWKPVQRLLERHVRVIVPNLPGHPGGVPLRGEPTVGAMADALVAQMQARGIQTAHVAGNSLGGWLSVELARRGFARSVTALSPAGGWRDDRDFQALSRNLLLRYRLMPIVWVMFWLFMGIAAVRKALGKDSMQRGDRVPTADFRSMLRGFMHTSMMPRLFQNAGTDGAMKPLEAPGVPVRVAWCQNDRILPFETYGQPFLDRVPQAEHVVIEYVGHVPMYDDPQAVAAVILGGCARRGPLEKSVINAKTQRSQRRTD